jgi:mRNA interferase RelE/StbE
MPGPYQIRYTTEALEDLGAVRAFDRSKVRAAILQHLAHQPTRISHSRIKRMTQPFWSQFRLRVGEFRVYYDVDEETSAVLVLRLFKKGTGITPEESP